MPTLPDGVTLPDLVALRRADGTAVEGEVIRLDRQTVAKEIARTWWQSVADIPAEVCDGEVDKGWDWPGSVGQLEHQARNTGHA